MGKTDPATDPAAKTDPGTDPANQGIPKARLDEVIGERNELRTQLDKLTTEMADFKRFRTQPMLRRQRRMVNLWKSIPT